MYQLGVDLGGTNIPAAVVDSGGRIIGSVESVKTPKNAGVETVADAIVQAARTAVQNAGLSLEDISTVGIGSPGIIDFAKGVIVYSCNLDFHNAPLAEILQKKLRKPVFLENDANAAALGEYAAGAGAGAESLIALTLGTGIGGGVIIGGRLLHGFNGAGAEIGHFVIHHNGRRCTCGRRGCFEAYCSATGLIAMGGEAMSESPESLLWTLTEGDASRLDGRLIFDAAHRQDPAAAEVVGRYIEYLGDGITSIINIFQPEVICIGGGIANQGEYLLSRIRQIVDREDYARDMEKRTRIVKAALGDKAGIIGAALLGSLN